MYIMQRCVCSYNYMERTELNTLANASDLSGNVCRAHTNIMSSECYFCARTTFNKKLLKQGC